MAQPTLPAQRQVPQQPMAGVRPVSRGTVQVGAVGQAAKTNVDLVDRPMSTHGMSGARPVSGTRTVMDATFFQTILRNKLQATNKEADALQNSTNELKKREQIVARLNDSVTDLRSRVQQLQGELHDITYSQSRFKEGASLDDLRTEAQKSEDEANKLRNEANIAFKAREEALQRLEKNEAAAAKMRADTEQRIQNDLGDEAAKQFRIIAAENNDLSIKENELREKLQKQNQLTSESYAHSFVLQNQQNQQNITKAIELHREIRAAKREIDQIRLDLGKGQMDDPEFSIKQQLKNQIAQESTECKRLMEDIKNLDTAIANRKRILTEITPDVMTSVTKEQKDMIRNVLKAEKQLTEWPRQKTDLVAQTSKLQQQSISLMQKLPNPLAKTDADSVNVEQSLAQKTRELERLSDQEQKVLTELRDVNTNVQQLNETLQSLQQAVGEAEQVDDVQGTEVQLKKELEMQVDKHKQLTQQLNEANANMNKLEEQLQQNEAVQTLRNLFSGLSQNLSKQYQAESFIKAKESESNYQIDKTQALQVLDNINKALSGTE